MQGMKEWAMQAHPEWFEPGFKAGGKAPNAIKEPEDEEAAPEEAAPDDDDELSD